MASFSPFLADDQGRYFFVGASDLLSDPAYPLDSVSTTNSDIGNTVHEATITSLQDVSTYPIVDTYPGTSDLETTGVCLEMSWPYTSAGFYTVEASTSSTVFPTEEAYFPSQEDDSTVESHHIEVDSIAPPSMIYPPQPTDWQSTQTQATYTPLVQYPTTSFLNIEEGPVALPCMSGWSQPCASGSSGHYPTTSFHQGEGVPIPPSSALPPAWSPPMLSNNDSLEDCQFPLPPYCPTPQAGPSRNPAEVNFSNKNSFQVGKDKMTTLNSPLPQDVGYNKPQAAMATKLGRISPSPEFHDFPDMTPLPYEGGKVHKGKQKMSVPSPYARTLLESPRHAMEIEIPMLSPRAEAINPPPVRKPRRINPHRGTLSLFIEGYNQKGGSSNSNGGKKADNDNSTGSRQELVVDIEAPKVKKPRKKKPQYWNVSWKLPD